MNNRRLKKRKFICIVILSISCFACGNQSANENSLGVNVPVAPNINNAIPSNNASAVNSTSSTPPTALENISREIFNKSFHPKTEKTPPPAKNPDNPIATRPAPDNSEIYAAMNAANQPMDVRVFKNNAFLLKMERIYVSEKEREIKIYLKNGKTISVAEDKIPNFTVASISSILKAANFVPQ